PPLKRAPARGPVLIVRPPATAAPSPTRGGRGGAPAGSAAKRPPTAIIQPATPTASPRALIAQPSSIVAADPCGGPGRRGRASFPRGDRAVRHGLFDRVETRQRARHQAEPDERQWPAEPREAGRTH